MSGLVKAKEYDFKDSNVALLGSDTDRDVKKAAAEYEEAWEHAGEKVGLQIWRIEKFKVVAWPKEKYGQFHKGDSYIILRTYKEEDSEDLQYDLHFWLGKESTQDEMGTAAYKTVELDTLLDDKPIQYREVESFESKRFKKYFKRITYLEGGVASGFNHVEVNNDLPPPCIFELCGDSEKDIEYSQVVKASWDNLHSFSAFVIIVGDQVIRFLGSKSNKNEKYALAVFLNDFKSAHPRLKEFATIDGDNELNSKVCRYLKKKRKEETQEEERDGDDDDDDNEDEDEDDAQLMEMLVSFFGYPPGDFDVRSNKEQHQVSKKKVVPTEDDFEEKLVCVVKDKKAGKVDMEVLACGEDMSSYACDEKHCYILDQGKEVFIYAGKKVNKNDSKNLMLDCNLYLSDKLNKNAPLSMDKNLKKFEERLKH